jgi:hypothetical protein
LLGYSSLPANRRVVRKLGKVLADAGRFGSLILRSRANLAAENLFLRKQLALYLERQVKHSTAKPPDVVRPIRVCTRISSSANARVVP